MLRSSRVEDAESSATAPQSAAGAERWVGWISRGCIFQPVNEPATAGAYETCDSHPDLPWFQYFDGKQWFGSASDIDGAYRMGIDHPHPVWGPVHWRPLRRPTPWIHSLISLMASPQEMQGQVTHAQRANDLASAILGELKVDLGRKAFAAMVSKAASPWVTTGVAHQSRLAAFRLTFRREPWLPADVARGLCSADDESTDTAVLDEASGLVDLWLYSGLAKLAA